MTASLALTAIWEKDKLKVFECWSINGTFEFDFPTRNSTHKKKAFNPKQCEKRKKEESKKGAEGDPWNL